MEIQARRNDSVWRQEKYSKHLRRLRTPTGEPGFESLNRKSQDYGKRHEDGDAEQTDEADDRLQCPPLIGDLFGCMSKDASCATN